MAVDINLSDSNAWDDSALKDSWNQALHEYKKYHSIHVKGQKLSEVLTKSEMEMLSLNGVNVNEGQSGASIATAKVQEEHNDKEDHIDDDEGAMDECGNRPALEPTDYGNHMDMRLDRSNSPIQGSKAIPHALMLAVEDESTRNLMMSWYWAGYYTGFRDGQQKSQALASA